MIGNIPLLVFFGVFAAIVVAYEFGRNDRSRADGKSIPQVEVMLEYRNATGYTTLRRIRTLRYEQRRRGRKYLLTLCNGGTTFQSFRIDRIISVANLDGELLDLQEFLTKTLGVTA